MNGGDQYRLRDIDKKIQQNFWPPRGALSSALRQPLKLVKPILATQLLLKLLLSRTTWRKLSWLLTNHFFKYINSDSGYTVTVNTRKSIHYTTLTYIMCKFQSIDVAISPQQRFHGPNGASAIKTHDLLTPVICARGITIPTGILRLSFRSWMLIVTFTFGGCQQSFESSHTQGTYIQ